MNMRNLLLFLTIVVINFSLPLRAQQSWMQTGASVNGSASNPLLGSSVAISGNGQVMAVASGLFSSTDAGIVEVYRFTDSTWVQMGSTLFGGSGDAGHDVSLSEDGTTLCVGEYNNAQVKIFSWSGSAWVQKGATITGSNGSFWGLDTKLSADGNTVVSGAYTGAGVVKIYSWNGSSWVQKGVDIIGPVSGASFGSRVDMSSDGNTVVVGAQTNSTVAGSAGEVRVYSWSGSAWVQKGLSLSGSSLGDYFGHSVAISDDGNTVAGGAPQFGFGAGFVRVYAWSGSAWQLQGSEFQGDVSGDNTGYTADLSADGSILAIGSPSYSTPLNDCGQVVVHQWDGSNWQQVGDPILGPTVSEATARSLSLSDDGKRLVAGAIYYSGVATSGGQARAYTYQYPISIEDRSNTRLSVAPNPFSSTLIISLPDNVQVAELYLYDITGKAVQVKSTLADDRITVNGAALSSGLYFAELRSKGEVVGRAKVVKE